MLKASVGRKSRVHEKSEAWLLPCKLMTVSVGNRGSGSTGQYAVGVAHLRNGGWHVCEAASRYLAEMAIFSFASVHIEKGRQVLPWPGDRKHMRGMAPGSSWTLGTVTSR